MGMTDTVQLTHLPSLSQFCPIPLFAFIIKNISHLLPRLVSSWRKRPAVYTLQEINKTLQFLISDKGVTCSSAPDYAAQCCSAENGTRGISTLLYYNGHLKQKESLNAMPRAEKLHTLLTVAVTC